MSSPARALATYRDLLALADDVRAEILGGRIVTAPAPLPKHSKVQRALGSFVGRPFDDDDGYGGPGGWWIFVEVDVELGPHDVVRPDLAGWRRERLPEPGDRRPIDVAPNWVCEILSTNRRNDLVRKKRVYHRHEVAHYWILDPHEETLSVLRWHPDGYTEVLVADRHERVRAEPFADVELTLAVLFGDDAEE